ncbi:DNA cytosine methyltransferase [Brevibacillus nitrificans]|uniref:DNA cytosine methyltransferase n=1 Tax=Brevibacillus nitrificans TaxID=651560 RepID=UPI002611F766|nr:DNA cytosine methyltransferase [Brevibacillus nitrificans]
MQEIIVDNFAGGGGASTGIELATGRSVDIAINHDPAAIAMHMTNHPESEHYCESVWDVDPREVTQGRPVGLCWLSPDCKHFSKAKGGKPKEKGIRGLAWVALRWAATVRPRVIMLENVEEFKTWGPLLKDGTPDPKNKGREFNAFINALKRQGYQVDHKELRACDYGAPTIRKRFFLIARCDGRPIVWPKPTHGDPESAAVKSGKLKPWRTAAEIIDWSLPCPSIFERKRPLAENTLRRIARGIQKFVIDNPNPFIVRICQSGFGGNGMQYSIDQPLTTIVTKAEHCLVVPHITKFRTGATGHELSEPLPTVTSGAGSKRPAGAAHAMGMVTAFLAQYHSETTNNDARGQTMDRPMLTLDTSNRYALVTSNLLILRNNQYGQEVNEPIPTLTAGGGHVGEVRAFLMAYYGSSVGQKVDEPLGTVTTRDRFGLVTIHGQDYQIVDIGMRMLEPHELFAAQGFPDTYIIDRDADGKSYPKSAQVARCGNSVPPPFAEALVRANLPEHCAGAGNVAVFERYKEQPAGQLALSI